MEKLYAIIVAGGSGSRMKSDLPKQFLPIKGKPILMITLEQFYTFDSNIHILLVLPKDQFDYWKVLCKAHDFTVPHQIIEGGNSRFQSVKSGLEAIKERGLVAIHDGVRPFISHSIIKANYQTASKYDSALTVVDLKDSIRFISSTSNKSLNRKEYKTVQTPQTFRIDKIKEAYLQKETDYFTDDASVYEANGGKVHLVDGDYRNIKITTPEDIVIAESLL